MPTLAGWLTGEQVPQEIIEQTLTAMGGVLSRHGGQAARVVRPGMGLLAYSDTAYAMQRPDEPPVLDWVPDRHTFVYRRPLSGEHVLYYIEDWPAAGNLLFASEIKALLAVGVPRQIHLAALDTLLRYGFIPAPWTAFKGISSVPAGSILRWQHTKTVVNQAIDFSFDDSPPQKTLLDDLYTLLAEKTAGMLPPHEQLIALTNGGSASALSTLLTAQHTSTPFSIAFIDYKKAQSDKGERNAEHVANACKRPLLEITGVDQPEFWNATLAGTEAPGIDTRALAFHQLLHTVATETSARVAMSGLGAHVLLGGDAGRLAEQISGKPDMLDWYGKTLSPLRQQKTSQLWSQDVARRLRQEEPWEESLHARKLARQAAKLRDKNQGWYYLDLHLRLPDSVVGPVEQLATQENMVVRSPYLKANVMKLLASLPTMLNDGTPKHKLLAALAHRFLPELEDMQPHSPLAAPVESLLRGDSSELLRQTLSAEALRATGIFDVQAVVDLLRQKEVSRELVLVFTTQLWYQMFGMGL